MIHEQLKQMLSQYSLGEKLLAIDEFKRGHIHDTYISRWILNGEETRFVHQKMNTHVFPDVDHLMENIVRVTEHVKLKLHSLQTGDRVFSVLFTKDGAAYTCSEDRKSYWRTFTFVENTKSINTCDTTEIAFEAASACGRFLGYLRDMDTAHLHVTIENFLNSEYRLSELQNAVEANPCDRKTGCSTEIDKCLARCTICDLVVSDLGSADLPYWVTHNDTKLNNVLFDAQSDKAVSIVDLDTCMPGSILYDFGDLVRTTSVLSAEDEPDPNKVQFDLELYRALARGFVGEVGRFLTPYEKEILHLAPKLLTLTLAMRFLADHLNGDRYFKIHFPGHNLQRAKAQLRVVECMEECEARMKEILASCYVSA